MFDEWIGIALIGMAITGFILSQSPLVTELLGGTIGENLHWAGSMSAVMIGGGVVFLTIRSMKIYALPLGFIAFLAVYILVNWGTWFG